MMPGFALGVEPATLGTVHGRIEARPFARRNAGREPAAARSNARSASVRQGDVVGGGLW